MEELKKRKPTRLKDFDYSTEGAYFITVCVEKRKRILSQIVGGDVLDAPQTELLLYGKIADKYINQLNNFYENIDVASYVIMPNHIHIMLMITEGGASRTSLPTKQHSAVSRFVSAFKRFCNKEYGHNIFQRSYYDHIIRNKEDFEEHLKYIYENPMKWHFDELYSEED